jgi:hypothetical protein
MTQQPAGRRPPEPAPMHAPPVYGPPPGYGAYPPPAAVLRPVRGLGTATAVLAAAVAFTEVLQAVLSWSAADTYADAVRAGVPNAEVSTAYDAVSGLRGLVLVAAFVVTCRWLWAARYNAEALSPRPHARSRGWVWGGWLVPVVLLWFPYQVVRDIRLATARGAAPPGPPTGLWWGLWLLALALGQAASTVIPPVGEPSLGRLTGLGSLETADAFAVVGAATVWIPILLALTRDQDEARGR